MDDDHRLRTQFTSAEDSTGLALWRVTNRWQAAQRTALGPFGLTHVQFVLLASLAWLESSEDAPVSQRELARHAGADAMMTSQVARVLEQRGLLRRDRRVDDRRLLVIEITEDGRSLANRAVVAVEGVDDEFFAALGQGRASFTASLARLVDRD